MCAVVAALLVATPAEELSRSMAARGVAPAIIAFAGSPEIDRLADGVAARSKDDTARAHALYDALLERKQSGAIAADRDNSPKRRPPKSAAELMRLSGQGEGDRRAGCYELSALYIAAARRMGLDAVGVERVDPVGTGQIGHIMAGVRFAAGGPLTVFDLQNETRGTPSRVRELGDLEMAAHHYNHLAVAAFLNGDLGAAKRAIDDALRLAPDAASFLNNRATIMGALGEAVIGVADATAAVQLAPDVPLYRYQLGRLLLVAGDVAAARSSLERALALRPRYGLARRDLGWAHLMAGDALAAEREVAQAMREEPSTPEASLYLGLIYVAGGRTAQALEVARRALAKDRSDQSLQALEAIAGGLAVKSGLADEVERLRAVLASVERAREVR